MARGDGAAEGGELVLKADEAEGMVRYARELVLAGMGIALGVVLPFVFHAVGAGMAGRVLLPMFLPVLLVGLLTRWWIAALVGAVTPLVSFLFTGMPGPPALFTMPVELPILAATASLLQRSAGVNVWVAAAAGVMAGRLALGALALGLGSWLGLPVAGTVYWLWAVVAGLPGTVLLIGLIPPLALAAQRYRLAP